ncbi:helix-turn-helix domain-containing protein [Emticicia sp. TH156]|uniref:helix-turn-helix domain-containing protein n=1 Tax=Emticicia sp. TH156 TaxID=2067454 RepID=UPI000C75EACC|nr:helix-turn-helix domain-containing protein [Emticicia sp. TH156]PLK43337.1 AraC family transcriptional regulator [Emticicia sp. TH156]
MLKQSLFEASLKKLGLLNVNNESSKVINNGAYKAYIKILYLPAGYQLTVDFNVYTTTQNSLFFVAPNQFLHIETVGQEEGYMIFYNRDFYCIQIHDAEVACDGLLFNNINKMPMVRVADEEIMAIDPLFNSIDEEFGLNDTSQEEMIRTYLKQLLIKSTRIWKKQHLGQELLQSNNELDFFRRFSVLVDAYYKEKHSVADYADLLSMAAKTITNKFKRLNLPQPNEVIKDRIVLEAKRLLIHTSMTAKEIAYQLGYEDPAYFSRQFLQKTGESPSNFKKKYLMGIEA